MDDDELTEQDIHKVTGGGSDTSKDAAIGIGSGLGGAAITSAYTSHKAGALQGQIAQIGNGLQNQVAQHANQMGELQNKVAGVTKDINFLKRGSADTRIRLQDLERLR